MLFRTQHFSLLRTMVIRDVKTKYQGTLLGIVWNLLSPLMMLAIYATVFLAVFKVKWPMADSSQADYGLMLFIGILTHGYMAEVLTTSSNIIRNNSNLVTKVRFPVALLPLIPVFSAGFNYLVGLLLATVYGIVMGYVHGYLGFMLLPLILVSYLSTLILLSYLVAALGVFLRDISQMMPVLITVLLFTSTVFFSSASAPELLAKVLYLNPISPVADAIRDIIYGQIPNFSHLLTLLLVSTIGALGSIRLFCRLKPSFSDIL